MVVGIFSLVDVVLLWAPIAPAIPAAGAEVGPPLGERDHTDAGPFWFVRVLAYLATLDRWDAYVFIPNYFVIVSLLSLDLAALWTAFGATTGAWVRLRARTRLRSISGYTFFIIFLVGLRILLAGFLPWFLHDEYNIYNHVKYGGREGQQPHCNQKDPQDKSFREDLAIVHEPRDVAAGREPDDNQIRLQVYSQDS